jgi:hypothetical protein
MVSQKEEICPMNKPKTSAPFARIAKRDELTFWGKTKVRAICIGSAILLIGDFALGDRTKESLPRDRLYVQRQLRQSI